MARSPIGRSGNCRVFEKMLDYVVYMDNFFNLFYISSTGIKDRGVLHFGCDRIYAKLLANKRFYRLQTDR
jgi:hypothetical protein